MSFFNNKVVWITGASSGIGEALSYAFAAEKAQLVISSNQLKELEQVKDKCIAMGAVCLACPFDLTEPQQIRMVAQEVLKKTGRIDILINNGGISQRALAEETPIELDRKIFEINFWGGVELTKQVLPSMIANKSGHIVALSSIAGKFGFKMRSAYSAAKHAIYGFYESLGVEMHGRGIYVTIATPGRVQTNISLNALTKEGKAHGQMDDGQAGGVTKEYCARMIMKAIRKKKKEQLIGGKELLMVHFKRFLPPLFNFLVTRIKAT